MIYAQSRILYEIIHEVLRSTNNAKKPKRGPHADGVVGLVKYPTVESLAKQLHEFFVKQSIVEVAKASYSSQNSNVLAQSSQKGDQ